jgi:hypothetical protein
VAVGAIVEDGTWLDRLHRELRGLLAPVFAQARSRLAAFGYIAALLAEPGDRRSCWQLAERAGNATPRRMQALLAEHAWDWTAALAALQRFILARLDGSTCRNSGARTASGATGRTSRTTWSSAPSRRWAPR